jgi:hypothetical protein
MIVKLQRDADDVVALRLQQRSRRRRIDAAGHGYDDPRVLWTAFEIETVEHGSESQAVPEKRTRLTGAAEKSAFHIVHIPVRQSRGVLLRATNGNSCRRAETKR